MPSCLLPSTATGIWAWLSISRSIRVSTLQLSPPSRWLSRSRRVFACRRRCGGGGSLWRASLEPWPSRPRRILPPSCGLPSSLRRQVKEAWTLRLWPWRQVQAWQAHAPLWREAWPLWWKTQVEVVFFQVDLSRGVN